MTLKEKIVEDMKTAMKEKNAIARDTLRVIKGEIERAEQDKNGKIELSDSAILAIIKKSIEGVKSTTNNQEEIDVLSSYLPKAMTKDEIEAHVKELCSLNQNMGAVIKEFNSKFPGRADGKELAQIVKDVLSK